jgi:tetratricopeptide (TPR) repeat protein/transglutaminase-like putative cysteine protease
LTQNRPWHTFVFLCLALSSIARTDAKSAEKSATPDFSQEPFVIESLKTMCRFEADGTGAKRVEAKVRIQSEAAVQQFGQLVLSYNSDFEKLTITGRVVKADGSTVAFPADAVQDMSSPVSQMAPMYSDVRQKHLIVPSLRPGDLLEYEMQFELFAAMAPNQFWTSYDFNETFIVRDEELRIDVPASKYVNVKTRDEYKPEISEKDGRRIYSWTASHLERNDDDRKDKKRRKPAKDEDKFPAVQVSTFKNWDEVGAWYAMLEKDRMAPSDAIRAKTAELTKGLADDTTKLEALYTYVAQTYRYVSLSFGVGRYQPHPAANIFTNQYGDCKDKHTLLASMIDAAGLHAYAALTSASRKVDVSFPSPSQFDHMITYIPGGPQPIWLDTTSEVAPFRLLVPTIRGKDALVVAVGGRSEIKKIPEEPAIPNFEGNYIEATINDLGTLDADVHLSFRGDVEVAGRLAVRAIPQAQYKDYIQYIANAAGLNGEVSNIRFSDIADTKKQLDYRFHITKLNYFNRFEKEPKLEFPLGRTDVADPGEPEGDKPIDLGTGRFEYRVKLRVPKQFEVHLPLPVKLDRDFGHYESKYSLDGVTLTGEREFETKLAKLPAARLSEFQAFRRTVMADIGQKVAIDVSKAPGAQEAAEVNVEETLQSAYSAYHNGQYQASIDLIERVLKKEPKHKSAYNDLGRAYRALQKYEEAETALKKAIEIDPYSPYAYNNLGLVYWNQQRYAEGEKAFQKQIEVNPLDEWAHANLGEMLNAEKKFAEAEPELEKAIAIAPDRPGILMALGSAQLNLGKAEKAKEYFTRAVNLAPSPVTWNNVAYTFAEHKTNLDLAQQYAESAVATVAAQLRNVQLTDLKIQHLGQVSFLASCWDTLGWVHFQKGNLPIAEKYLLAAWKLSQNATVGDHLGQFYELKGQRERAIELYSMALAASHPEPETKPRLAKLVGDSKVDSYVDHHRAQLSRERSFAVPEVKSEGTAEFYIELSPNAKVEDVRYISGSNKLKELGTSLKNIDFKTEFPDERDTRIVRRGILSCSGLAREESPVLQHATKKTVKPESAKTSPAGPCTFVLLTPDSIRDVN